MNIITITKTIDTHIEKIQSIIKKKIDCQVKLQKLQKKTEEINLSNSEEIKIIKKQLIEKQTENSNFLTIMSSLKEKYEKKKKIL